MKQFFLILVCLGSLSLNAQHKNRSNTSSEKIEAQKIAFFTQKLDLTPEEAKVFWPVYNEYSERKKELRNMRISRTDLETIDDAEASNLIDEYFKNKEQGLALDKEYILEFKKILPSKKVLTLVILERKFKEKILNDFKKSVGDRGKRGGQRQ